MPENKITSHLTQNTSLASAINSWEMFLADQGRSPNTIKAFRPTISVTGKWKLRSVRMEK